MVADEQLLAAVCVQFGDHHRLKGPVDRVDDARADEGSVLERDLVDSEQRGGRGEELRGENLERRGVAVIIAGIEEDVGSLHHNVLFPNDLKRAGRRLLEPQELSAGLLPRKDGLGGASGENVEASVTVHVDPAGHVVEVAALDLGEHDGSTRSPVGPLDNVKATV